MRLCPQAQVSLSGNTLGRFLLDEFKEQVVPGTVELYDPTNTNYLVEGAEDVSFYTKTPLSEHQLVEALYAYYEQQGCEAIMGDKSGWIYLDGQCCFQISIRGFSNAAYVSLSIRPD